MIFVLCLVICIIAFFWWCVASGKDGLPVILDTK